MAWHLGGHHVAVHATVVGETLAVTPSFLGANPAVVRTGPMAGLQVLREEESLARDLLAALSRDQCATWPWCRTRLPRTSPRGDPVADPDVVPAGLRYDALDRSRPRLEALVRWYLGGPRRRWPSRRGEAVAEAVWVR